MENYVNLSKPIKTSQKLSTTFQELSMLSKTANNCQQISKTIKNIRNYQKLLLSPISLSPMSLLLAKDFG